MSERIRNLFKHDLFYGAFWIAVVVLLFFLPVVIGRQSLTQNVPTFYSALSPAPQVQIPWQVDAGTHTIETVPLDKAEAQKVRSGIPPIWDAYLGGGQSQTSNVSGEFYYPLRFIFFLVWNSTRAFDWYFLLRFFIAGFGMFLYLRTIGLRRIISLWGGIGYAFTGYFTLYITYPFLDIDSLFPWTLWAIERYVKESNIGRASLIGFFLAMTIVIGHPQVTIIALLLAALYFVWRTIVQTEIRKQWFRIIYHVLFVVVVALFIASPFIADFLINYGQGKLAVDTGQWKGLLNFPPILFLHFIVTPMTMFEVAMSGHLADRYELIIPYMGTSVLILFLVSFFIKKKPLQLAPLYAWIAFVILKNAGFPLVQLIGMLPVLNQIGWYKAYGPMAGAMVICGAVAFESILRDHREDPAIWWREFYKFIAIIPLLFVAAYAFARDAFLKAYVPNFDFFNRRPDMIEKITALLSRWPESVKKFMLSVLQDHGGYLTVLLFVEVLLFAAATLTIIRYVRRKSRYAVLAMVIFTIFELFLYMPKIRDGFHYIDLYKTAPPYISFLEGQMKKEELSRIFPLGGIFGGYLGELYKIQTGRSFVNIPSRRYALFLPDGILRENSTIDALVAPQKLPEVPQKFFDAYDIRYFISEETLLARPGMELIYDADLKIYQNNSALPKAYVVFQKETASSPEQARSIFYGASFDPHNAVILEDRNAISLPQVAGAQSYSPAVVTSYASNEVKLTAQTDKDGILILTDIFYPGWQAYLDGKKVVTYPANVMFRGIFLPAGDHAVTFVYEPWWFWPSITVSLLTISGMIILAIYSSRKKIRLANNAKF